VPLDIVESFGRKELCYSLKTKDYSEAIRKVRYELSEAEQSFEQHRKALAYRALPTKDSITQEQLEYIHKVYYQFLLEEDDATRVYGFYQGDVKGLPTTTFDEYKEDVEEMGGLTKTDYAQGKIEGFSLDEAHEVLSWDGIEIKLSEDSSAIRQVARVLQEASLAAFEAIKGRNEGNVIKTPKEVPQAPNVSAGCESGLLLSSAIEEWVEDKSRSESWTLKTVDEYRRAVRDFMDLCGDRPIGDYTKADARAFRRALLILPPRWKHHKKLEGLSMVAAANKAEKLELVPMKPKTANKVMGFVSSLWSWMLSNYDINNNIFDKLKIEVKSWARDEKHPFTIKELNTIFQSPLFEGCHSIKNTRKSGSFSMKHTAKYWAPIISLYSGMRVNEILQLHLDDLKVDGGIHYFDINIEEDKRLKTASSRRTMPIHQNIIDAGFMDFVSKRRGEKTKSKQLFIGLKPDAYGSYTDVMSSYFSSYLEHIKVKHERNSFHSFRHTFEDACREND
tara:strand:+ start:988 stop:2505 length:1518 start_codon:yes stop_codon:yes gene_type:complete